MSPIARVVPVSTTDELLAQIIEQNAHMITLLGGLVPPRPPEQQQPAPVREPAAVRKTAGKRLTEPKTKKEPSDG